MAERRDKKFAFNKETFLHIRVLPQSAQSELSRTETMRLATEGNLQVLNDRAGGWSKAQNKYGVVIFESDHDTGEILSATQLFKSREIWGVDTQMLSPDQGRKVIPTGWHEHLIARALHHYVSFATDVLAIQWPLVVEVGLSNIEGYTLAMDGAKYWNAYWGPIPEKNVVLRRTIMTSEPAEIDKFLLDLFHLIFDAAGTTRPEKYNQFPGDEPGSLPRG